MHIIRPDEGEIVFDGRKPSAGRDLDLQTYRRQVQMVFQDSYASLNPRLTVEDTVAFGPARPRKSPPSRRSAARMSCCIASAWSRGALPRAIRMSFPAGNASG